MCSCRGWPLDSYRLRPSRDDAKDLGTALTVNLPRDGAYFIAINDAHERGGVLYTYAIQISAGR